MEDGRSPGLGEGSHQGVPLEAHAGRGGFRDHHPLTYGSFPAVASIAAPASSSTAVESHVAATSWLRAPSGAVAWIVRSAKRTSCFASWAVTGCWGALA